METLKKIETYFSQEHLFKKEIQELRKILLSTPLKKTFKWSFPTYTINHKNVLSIVKFKNHYGIWFLNVVFLSGPSKVLSNAQEGKTKAMRQWKLTNKHCIESSLIITYCKEAIANEKKD